MAMNSLTRVRDAEMERENLILEVVAAAAGDDLQLDWREEIFRADVAIVREDKKSDRPFLPRLEGGENLNACVPFTAGRKAIAARRYQ